MDCQSDPRSVLRVVSNGGEPANIRDIFTNAGEMYVPTRREHGTSAWLLVQCSEEIFLLIESDSADHKYSHIPMGYQGNTTTLSNSNTEKVPSVRCVSGSAHRKVYACIR